MEQREYVAALDLGTSKMLAMAASKDRDGVLTILEVEKLLSGTSIRRGCVYNIEEAASKVSSLVNKLSNKLHPGLKKIYVGIGGQSLRSECYTVRKEINGMAVNNRIMDSLLEECKKYTPELSEVLDIVSPEYFLDGRLEMKPIGVPCNVIEAKFQLILGRPSLKICLKKSIEEKAKVEIADFFVSPIATAAGVLNDKEKELGCALIEFGAGVTYLSIYKNGLLRYMIAIPLGGSVITKDLCSINLLEHDAEELKITQGSAFSESDKEEQTDIIIEARMNEILANVFEQIRYSGYENSLGEGIVITGGASQLKNLDKAIEKKEGNYKVRMATINESLINIDKSDNATSFLENPTNSTIVGLLHLAEENCAKDLPKQELNKDQNTIITNNTITDLFGEETESSKRETEKKKLEIKKTKKRNIFDKFRRGVEGISKDLFDSEDDNTDE